MDTRLRRLTATLVLTTCAVAGWAAPLSAQVRAAYLYTLSDFAGRTSYSWARISVDQERGEIYVIYGNIVRIYSPSGMETYSFGDDLDLGQIADLAVDKGGNIILLSYKEGQPLVTRCNYRGVPLRPVEIRKLPDGLHFGPNRMVHRNGLLYFAATSTGSLIVTDASGEFREHVDVLPLLELEEKQRAGAELNGFSVDTDGNVFFTVSIAFKAYKLSPDRKVEAFGRPGSTAGRFSVIGGIATDSRGNVLVADKLRCVVMIFDKAFNFVGEFGYRGARPENLVQPDDLALDAQDRLYVTQARRRGVSVFSLVRAD